MMAMTEAVPVPASIAAGSLFSLCKHCKFGGSDLKVLDCGCCFHARCCPMNPLGEMVECPSCSGPVRVVQLLPMDFCEIDTARAVMRTPEAPALPVSVDAGNRQRTRSTGGAKIEVVVPEPVTGNEVRRHSAGNLSLLDSGSATDNTGEFRTGRWTNEETAFCDKLIDLFEDGQLPVEEGTKLSDFLAAVFKSKQSRLTKKMKHAGLAARVFNGKSGYITSSETAHELTRLENDFLASVTDRVERAEMRFHMENQWREIFSSRCLAFGQTVDGASWLTSLKELDRRLFSYKDTSGLKRRQSMIQEALRQDYPAQQGVFINDGRMVEHPEEQPVIPLGTFQLGIADATEKGRKLHRPLRYFSSPFAGKAMEFIQRKRLPFEHIDIWVPSLVSCDGVQQNSNLCFAGCATSEVIVPRGADERSDNTSVLISAQDQFDLISFGEYSQKFSFAEGAGLPGRVYSSGESEWVENLSTLALQTRFERVGGARQWRIQTALAVPVPSPSVGRIVLICYSKYSRAPKADMAGVIETELNRLLPSPRWKLVVDIGPSVSDEDRDGEKANKKPIAAGPDTLRDKLLQLANQHMPINEDDVMAPYLPGFAAIVGLLDFNCTPDSPITPTDRARRQSALKLYAFHRNAGKPERDCVWMTARDFMRASNTPLSVGGATNDSTPHMFRAVSHGQMPSSEGSSSSLTGQGVDNELDQKPLAKSDGHWPSPLPSSSDWRLDGQLKSLAETADATLLDQPDDDDDDMQLGSDYEGTRHGPAQTSSSRFSSLTMSELDAAAVRHSEDASDDLNSIVGHLEDALADKAESDDDVNDENKESDNPR